MLRLAVASKGEIGGEFKTSEASESRAGTPCGARERGNDRPISQQASFAHRHVYVSRSAGRKEAEKKERKKERKKGGRKLFREKPDSSSVRCQIRDRLKLFASITKLRQNKTGTVRPSTS